MKKTINNITNGMKIRTQLIVSYLAIVIITVVIIGGYLTSSMNKIVVENAINEGRHNNIAIKNRLEEIVKLAINTSDMIYQDEELHKLVMRSYENYGQVVQAYSEYNILTEYWRHYNEFTQVNLYVDNGTLLNGANIIKVNDEIRKEEWYENSIENKGIINWLYKKDENTKSYNLSLIRAIFTEQNSLVGVLVISLNPKTLSTVVQDERYCSTILLDNVVVASNEFSKGDKLDLITNKEAVSYYYELKEEFRGVDDHEILNTFKVDKSFSNTFQVLVKIPMDIITVESRGVIERSLVIIALAIGVSLIIILYFSKNLSDRINFLRGEMRKVVNRNFNIEKSMNGKDEIAEAYDDLYTMMESINKLIEEVYVRKIQQETLQSKQREAEFKMLASQINPHFLYNTLETIRMRAFCNGDKELSDIVKKLGKIMRRNLEVSEGSVSLASELELVKYYLEIQELRFKGKVEHEFNIEVETTKYEILPLILQPVVENAFVHGLEGIRGKGKIVVSAFEDLGYLIVEISDNGCGIPKDKLNFINENLGKSNKKENGHKSIGMSNINERIKIYYGDEYGMYLFSEVNVGTKVVLLLPAIEGEENLC